MQSAFVMILIREKINLLHFNKMTFICNNLEDKLKSEFVKTKDHKKHFLLDDFMYVHKKKKKSMVRYSCSNSCTSSILLCNHRINEC